MPDRERSAQLLLFYGRSSITEITSKTSSTGVAQRLSSGGNYYMAKDAVLLSRADDALYLGGSGQDYTLDLRGYLQGQSKSGAGLFLQANNNNADISMTGTALLNGAYGIQIEGTRASSYIYNNGTIKGDIDGIHISADGDYVIKSPGDITAKSGSGIFFDGDGTLKIIFQGVMHGAITSTGDSAEYLSVSGDLMDGMSLGAGDDMVHNDTILDSLVIGTSDLGAGDDTFYGGTKPDTVTGGKGDDVICGFGGNDVLYGGSGNDHVQGGLGVDQLYGGSGDDDYHVDAQHDVIHENPGDSMDRVFTYSSYKLNANDDIEALFCRITDDTTAMNLTGNAIGQQIFGNAGYNKLKGLAGDDKLYGNGGNDYMDGGTGADIMFGENKSNDTYVVDNIGDKVREPGGGTDLVISSITYKLKTGVDNLHLTGSDYINGTGNEGKNVIAGNSVANVLTGGDGRDTFVFNTVFGKSNYDTITDFNHSADTFKIDNGVFDGLDKGVLSKSSFQIISSANSMTDVDRDDFILYDKDDGNLYFDRDGSGSKYERTIFAEVTDNTVLDYTDFLVY